MSGKREVKQLKAETDAMQRRAEAAEEDWQRAEETIDALAEKLREANDEIAMRGVIIAKLCDAMRLAVNGPTLAIVISETAMEQEVPLQTRVAAALAAAQNRKS